MRLQNKGVVVYTTGFKVHPEEDAVQVQAGVATYCHNHEDIKADVDLKVFLLFLLRYGCREHFVSGCWPSSGRDRGRYTRECWLSTLGVLHPGVPVMWYGHIRDLSPTAEAVRGGARPM